VQISSTHSTLAQHLAGRWLASVALLLTLAAPAWAQEIGTAAEVVGTVEIVRGGTRVAVTLNTAINTGDEIQTGTPGRAVFVFKDSNVLIVTDNSHVRIDEHTLRSDGTVDKSVVQLWQGKARALVSDSYRAANATYEVHTPTAVIDVQGTEFVMTYDPVAEVTDVVGVSGTVRVLTPTGTAARGAVLVTTQELTTIAKGDLPTPPKYIPDTRFRGYLDGLEFIGAGRPETLTGGTLMAGGVVHPPEKAAAFPSPPAVRGEPGDLPVRPRTPSDPGGEPLPPVYYPPSSLGNVGVSF